LAGWKKTVSGGFLLTFLNIFQDFSVLSTNNVTLKYVSWHH
jgi:hypothetical protein